MSCERWKIGICKGCKTTKCPFRKKCNGGCCTKGIPGPLCNEYTIKEILGIGITMGVLVFLILYLIL